MRLSDLQTKEVVDVSNGKRIGSIIDITVDSISGRIASLILEQGKNNKRFLSSREEYEIIWNQIIKIGDDIILIDTKNHS